MKAFLILLAVTVCYINQANSYPDINGQQPQISKDVMGVIRIVYGSTDSIFCITSRDGGAHFSIPVLAGVVRGMHLGMARGPQIASSNQMTIITAINKEGNIFCFRLNQNESKWSPPIIVNDIKGSAPEGLMGLASDNEDNFYATWLDIRKGKTNNVCFSKLSKGSSIWSRNSIVYTSPDKHVCECCKPSIAVNSKHVTIMFRNWLNGSRDLYVINSSNAGTTFSSGNKLGEGTWKLNGCPMDGGSLVYESSRVVSTVWRRNGSLYYCTSGRKEQMIDDGKNVFIAKGNNKDLISYTKDGEVKLNRLNTKQPQSIGKGDYLKVMNLKDKILCVWEDNHTIKIKMV